MFDVVGTQRAAFLPFVIQTTEGRKDPGNIHLGLRYAPEILRAAQDDIRGIHFTIFTYRFTSGSGCVTSRALFHLARKLRPGASPNFMQSSFSWS